jgi:D-3-phosphoglycerate dehydrogenase / 2-oxoglutarate reductase
MKILVSDKLSQKGMEILQKEGDGLEVHVKTGLTPAELIKEIPPYHGLIVRSSTKVTANIIEAADNLKIIGRAGIGVDNIDLEGASKRGIIVMNTPEGNAITTAEHTISLMLALSRKIPQANSSVKSKKWEKGKFMGVEVFNKTLGIIGLGRIGRLVGQKAQGLGMNTIAYDPYISSDMAQSLGTPVVELDELLARADYVTVHTPKTNETTYLIGNREFEKMKKGVRIINCARGGIIDEKALYEAIVSGKVAGAALDVFEEEPPGDNPLLDLDGVISTPHLGAATEEAQDNVAIEIAHQMISFFKHGEIKNAVNLPSMNAELYARMEPYITLAEKLGSLEAQLLEGGLKEIKISYYGEVAELEIRYLTASLLKGLLEHFIKERINSVNSAIIAKERGIKVTESILSQQENYSSLIRLEAITDKEAGSVAGTLFGRRDARLVEINSSPLEAILSGHMLVFYNQDMPGVIGKIGTILGNNKINIAGMNLGRKTIGGMATALVSIDAEIPESVLTEIRAWPIILYAKKIKL